MVVYRPETLSEALSIRKDLGARPFAGGTDLMVKYRGEAGAMDPQLGTDILFLDNIREIQDITLEGDRLKIGAGVTLTDIIDSDLPVPTLLIDALKKIAAPGLRNRATLAGNVCNASPAGDSIPVLQVLKADVNLTSAGDSLSVPVEQFITGPGRTVLAHDELVESISLTLPRTAGFRFYRKVGTRRANALTKLSLAALGDKDCFRMSAGAVGPRVIRLREAEKLVLNRAPLKEIIAACEPLVTPIDDQRSTAEYRKTTCLNLIRDCVEKYWKKGDMKK